MSDVYRETCFGQRDAYEWAKHWIAITGLNRKDISLRGNTQTFQKKFQMQWSIMKVMLTVLCDRKRPTTIDFLEKTETVNTASHYQLLRQYSPYLLNDPHIFE